VPYSPVRNTNPFDDDTPDEPVGLYPLDDVQQKTNPVQNDVKMNSRRRPSEEMLSVDPGDILSAGQGDILSAGTVTLGSIVTDDLDTNVRQREDPAPVRRPHPWDSSIPVAMGNVDMKETSMELADGVEARFTPKYDNGEPLPGGSPISRMRRNRIAKNEELAAPPPPPPPTRPNLKESLSGDDFDVNPMLLISEDNHDGYGWEVTTGGFSSRRQENANNLSDEYDSAWVALPSSTFFAGKSKGSPDMIQPRPPKRDMSGIPPHISVTPDEDFLLDEEDDEEEGYAPEVSRRDRVQTFSPEMQESARVSRYTPPEPRSKAMHPPAAYDEGFIGDTNDEDEMGSIEVALVEPPPVSGAATESRGRRGLRGLLTRRSQSKGAPKLAASSEVGAGSRRFNADILLQQALDPLTGEIAPPANSRGRNRRGAKSPSRERAQSLEERRTRNPTIAKKFSRLMRLYDDEEGYI
jgi:hypothetical protein